MDKRKKIIVTIVTLVFVVVLLGFVKIMLFPSGNSDLKKDRVSIITPQVDEKRIDRVSKIREYTQGKLKKGDETDVIQGFSRFEEGQKEEKEKEEAIIVGVGEDPEAALGRKDTAAYQPYTIPNNGEEAMDSELKELMKLQEEFLAQSQAQQQADAQNYMNAEELESLLKTYDQYAKGYYGYGQQPATPDNAGLAASGSVSSDSAAIAETKKKADERLANATTEKFSGSKHFQGAGAINTSDSSLDLIPAETVDRNVLVNGSTVAIRTKKSIQLQNPTLLIPKGAVVYGKVSFSPDRLFIDIESYKEGNKLYPLNFKMFDFDGREGVHLGNRTWPKIPSKVAEDVYDFAYQRGTQATAFGVGGNDIDPDQLKNIAILSASREITNEIFDKRRILMPKKYHLWLNVSPN